MENYESKEDEESVGLHDKLHDKFPQLSEKAFEILEVLEDDATDLGLWSLYCGFEGETKPFLPSKYFFYTSFLIL